MVYCVYSAPILFDVDRVCDCIQHGWFGSLKTCFLPRDWKKNKWEMLL